MTNAYEWTTLTRDIWSLLETIDSDTHAGIYEFYYLILLYEDRSCFKGMYLYCQYARWVARTTADLDSREPHPPDWREFNYIQTYTRPVELYTDKS